MTRLRALARAAAAVLTFPALVLVGVVIYRAEERRDDESAREAHRALHRGAA